MGVMALSLPERQLLVRRAAARLCGQLAWPTVHEMPLDTKWPDYRAYCDALYFAVDTDFPSGLLPDDTGWIVAYGQEAEIVREAPAHPLPPARRRALLHRFATIAACRLAALEDPLITASLRAALRVE